MPGDLVSYLDKEGSAFVGRIVGVSDGQDESTFRVSLPNDPNLRLEGFTYIERKASELSSCAIVSKCDL